MCLDLLGLNIETLLSVFIYSQDWNAFEAVVLLLFENKQVPREFLSRILTKPDDKLLKELRLSTEVLNLKDLSASLLRSAHHAMHSGKIL